MSNYTVIQLQFSSEISNCRNYFRGYVASKWNKDGDSGGGHLS